MGFKFCPEALHPGIDTVLKNMENIFTKLFIPGRVFPSPVGASSMLISHRAIKGGLFSIKALLRGANLLINIITV
jgi:hypothetical protein